MFVLLLCFCQTAMQQSERRDSGASKGTDAVRPTWLYIGANNQHLQQRKKLIGNKSVEG